MISFKPNNQLTMFNKGIMEQIDQNHKFSLLAKEIDFDELTNKFSEAYSALGRTNVPIRLLTGLTIVKFFENLSDAQVIDLYMQSPYLQFLCGQVEFQTKVPCSSGMLSLFRKRIGVEGCNEIFRASVSIHGKNAQEDVVIADTTAQPKNITFPTDVKLLNKVIIRCQKLAKKYKIKLNNTYKKEVKNLLKTLRFERGKEKVKEVKKAKRRLTTIAGRLVRELQRKMTDDQRNANAEDFINYNKVIDQCKGPQKDSEKYLNEAKTLRDIIDECMALLETYGIKIRNSPDEKAEGAFENLKNASGRGKEAKIKDGISSLKKVCRELIKKLEKKLSKDQLEDIKEDVARFKETLNPQKKDTKIYSLHEPHVACIAKGKAGKKYEFGSKASIAITKDSGIIVGAVNFEGNPHDSNTMEKTVAHVGEITGKLPNAAYADRGYKGAQEKNPGIKVYIPSSASGEMSKEEKEEIIANFGRRSAIEPIIGHVKNDFRLARTFLKGVVGDKINLLLSCAAFNLKKWIRSKIGKVVLQT